MEAGGALCEIRECLSRAFLVTKNVQIDFGWFGRRFGNDPFKNRAHTVHLFVQRRGESFTGRKTQDKCESSQSFRFLRNRVALLLSFDLQTMLNTPEIFIQAEEGIRYYKVTGVQTCALPI